MPVGSDTFVCLPLSFPATCAAVFWLKHIHTWRVKTGWKWMAWKRKKKRNRKTPAVMVSSGQWGEEESGGLDELTALRLSVRIQSTAFLRRCAKRHQSTNLGPSSLILIWKKKEPRGAFTFLQPPTPSERSDSQCAGNVWLPVFRTKSPHPGPAADHHTRQAFFGTM